MSKSLGVLTLDLVAKVGSFTGPMEKAGRVTKQQAAYIDKSLKQAATAFAGLSTAAAAAVSAMVITSTRSADESRKQAQAIGLTTDAYTALTFAASQNGLTTSDLNTGINQLNRSMLEAAVGTEKHANLFDALGVSVFDASGQIREGDKVLSDLADQFAAMPDGAQKSALAMQLFGESGAKMVPLLNSGSEGIDKLTKQAEALGLVISDKTAKQAEAFNDNLAVLGAVSKGTANQFTARLLPAMTGVTEKLVDMSVDGALSAVVLDDIAEATRAAAKGAVATVAGIHLLGQSLNGLREINESAKGDGAWWEAWVPPVRIYRAWQNFDDVKETANETGDSLSDLALDWAELMTAIDSASGDDTKPNERLKDMRDLLNDLRNENGENTAAAKAAAAAIREQEEAHRDYLSLAEQARGVVESTWSDQTKALKEYQDQVEILRKALMEGAIGQDEYDRTVEALDARNALVMSKNSEQLESVLDFLKTEEEQLAESYERRRQIILDSETLAQEEKNAVLLELEQKHQGDIAQMEAQRTSMMLANSQQLFDGLGGMAAAFAGEQSDVAQAMFAVSKAFAIADAIVKIQQGIASAAVLPFPANIPAMATVAAATGSIVSTIQGTQLQGMAHEGIDKIPQTGTWLLEKGERVTTAETSAKLDRTLDDVRKGGGGTVVNLYEDARRAGQTQSKQIDGKTVIDVFVSNIMADGAARKAIRNSFGLKDHGK